MEEIARLCDDRLIVAVGDITTFRGDAIVNAANSSLSGGGGVDGAIHAAGGPDILAECRAIRTSKYPEGLPPGQAIATTAGRLQAKHVIHTVGPIWHGGADDEEDLLESAYRESLRSARSLGVATIAFPAISTGVYRFPKELAARIALRVTCDYLETHDLPATVWLVFFAAADASIFLQAIG